jgi:hypothetical protein
MKKIISAKIILFLFIPLLAWGQARTVKMIRIETSGQSLEADPASIALCKQFTPSLKETKLFFNRAYYVEKEVMTKEQYSPCYATGRLIYSDNTLGQWTLYAGGAASIILNADTRNEVILYSKEKLALPPCSTGVTNDGLVSKLP